MEKVSFILKALVENKNKIINYIKGLYLLIFNYRLFDLNILKGKRIVIVGPADSLIDSNSGNYIDGFDFVVRLNRAPLILKEGKSKKDIGSKTDILFHSFYENDKSGGGPIDFELYRYLGINYIINPLTGYWGLKFSHNYYKRAKKKELIYRVPLGLYKGLLKSFSPFRPTTGFYALKFLIESDFAELYITGFTFFKTGYQEGYRDHVKKLTDNLKFIEKENQHSPEKEFNQFLMLLKKNNAKNIHFDSVLEEIIQKECDFLGNRKVT